MSKGTKNISFTLAQEVSPIVLNLTPIAVQTVSRTPVSFTTQGSASTDNSALTFSWQVNVPIGSELSELEVSSDGTEAVLYPDVNGAYQVVVTATNPSGAVSSLTATAIVVSDPFKLQRLKPNADFIGESVSSFWKLLENKSAVKSMWQEYLKLLSGDYKKLGELVLSKSIRNIQPGRYSSNILIDTEVDLSSHKTKVKFSESFLGNRTGFTSYRALLLKAIVESPSSIFFPDAKISSVNTGTVVEVYDSDLGGEYKVNKVSSNRILLSATTYAPSSSLASTITDLVLTRGSDVVFTTSANTVVKGNYVLISGTYYEVLDTYSTDPTLPGANYFKIDSRMGSTKQVGAKEFRTVSVSVVPLETGLSSVFYVPASELGGNGYFSSTNQTASVTITAVNKIRIGAALGNIQGATVTFLNGSATGFTTKIIAPTYSTPFSTEFTIEPKLNIPTIDQANLEEATALINLPVKFKDLLLTSDGNSCEITDIQYTKDANGDYFARIKVAEEAFLAAKTSLSWRVCNTLVCETHTEFRADGVSPGDVLTVELSNSLNPSRSFVNCTVVGAYKNKIAFEVTTEPLVNSDGDLVSPDTNNEELARIFQQLQIPASGKTQFDFSFFSIAADAIDMIPNVKKQLKYKYLASSTFSPTLSTDDNTIYVSSGSKSDCIFRLGVKPTAIRRNSRIPINSSMPVYSLSTLTEFIYPKQTSAIDGSSKLAMLHNDGSVSIRTSPELLLLENVHYTLQNELSFTGTDLNKSANSLIVTAESGSFIDRGVDPGDYFICRGVTYLVKSVLSSISLEIAEDTNTDNFKSLAKTNEQYAIKKKTAYARTYISFRAETFSVSNPAPKSLFANSVVLDNSKQIQDNFGALVGYSLEDFSDYSTPQITYNNAVLGLMYAWSTGPTVYSSLVASNILLNLPISEKPSVVSLVDKENGKIVLQEISRDTDAPIDSYRYYTFSTEESYNDFYSIAFNPATGEEYKVGDLVSPMTPLTGKVLVQDVITSPGELNPLKLRKYHSWYIAIDAHSVDSRDIPLLAKYFNEIKPIYTKPNIQLVLFLVDEVQIKVALNLDLTMRLYDDPGFGLELTHMVDSNNNSSQSLRLNDNGELSTRTLFLGKDLVVSSSTRFTSARGGFVLEGPFSTSTEIAIQNDTKVLQHMSPFSGEIPVRGKYLVQVGDIVRVYTGKNHGIYEVTAVVDDNTIDVQPLSGYLPYTRTPVADETKVNFGIFRLVSPIIVPSLTSTSVSGSEISFTGEALNWDGVSVGDYLIESSNFLNKYEILDIEYDPVTEDASVTLTLDSAAPNSTEFFIYREALVHKHYASGEISSYDPLDAYRLGHDFTDIYKIDLGDTIEIMTGSHQGELAKVIKITSSAIFISEALTSLASGDEFRLIKEARATQDSSDKRLEFLHGYDDVSITLESLLAMGQPSIITTLPSGIDTRTISNLSSDLTVEPGDIIKLLDGLGGSEIFVGTVQNIASATSVVCYVDAEDASISTSTQYHTEVIRRAKP